jgi:hypothetical protein
VFHGVRWIFFVLGYNKFCTLEGERWNTSIRNLIALVHPVQKRMLSRGMHELRPGQVFNRYSAYQVFAVAGFEFSSENQEY